MTKQEINYKKILKLYIELDRYVLDMKDNLFSFREYGSLKENCDNAKKTIDKIVKEIYNNDMEMD